MPRLIKPETKALLSDETWLRDQHVDKLYSIVEIAKNLSVTPAVIRKSLRYHNIISPPQQQLREASNTRKYGVQNPGMVKEFREKALNTMIDKFGGHVWGNAGKRNERDATCERLYGDVNVGKTEYAQNKAKQTNVERYGREHINQTHIADVDYQKISSIEWIWEQHNNNKRSLSDIADECGVDMSIIMNRLRQHDLITQHFFHSTSEKEILQFISDLLPDTQILNNVRNIIAPNELDIFIPEYGLAIEYCGLYWHSDDFKSRTYHLKKLQECNKQGIRLLTIFEDEWTEKPHLIKDKIQHILGKSDKVAIPARKTKATSMSTQEKDDFFEQNHIQGTGPGSVTYGLIHNNQTIAAMTFVHQKDNVYILNRYATSCVVPGGFGKLLSHFKKEHTWKQLVSFADMRWSDGNLYEQMGWTLDKDLPVDYYWCKNGKRYHKFGFRHKHLSNKLKVYNPDLPETTNCKNNGYTKIYNCGLKRYVINRPN